MSNISYRVRSHIIDEEQNESIRIDIQLTFHMVKILFIHLIHLLVTVDEKVKIYFRIGFI
jgi:hypothetical protein